MLRRLLIASCLGIAACVSPPKDNLLPVFSAGFAAKQTCSCLFVSKRTLDSCKADFDISLGPQLASSLSWSVSSDAVTVTLGDRVAVQTARYDAGSGCHELN